MTLIKSLKNKEQLYSRTVKEGEGKLAFKQNDQNYIAFANQPKSTYINTQGQRMQVPQSVEQILIKTNHNKNFFTI